MTRVSWPSVFRKKKTTFESGRNDWVQGGFLKQTVSKQRLEPGVRAVHREGEEGSQVQGRRRGRTRQGQQREAPLGWHFKCWEAKHWADQGPCVQGLRSLGFILRAIGSHCVP